VVRESTGDPGPRVLPEGFREGPVGGGEERYVQVAGGHASRQMELC
jgi:hypothetical protein